MPIVVVGSSVEVVVAVVVVVTVTTHTHTLTSQFSLFHCSDVECGKSIFAFKPSYQTLLSCENHA